MIKHIVCFKLFDSSSSSKKHVKNILMSMKENVPIIRNIEVGTDFLCSARSYDVILQVTLDDETALDEYQNDLYHRKKVKTYMHNAAVSSVAVDYYID